MKSIYLLLILFTLTTTSVFSQNNQDSIIARKSLFGYSFFQHDKKLNLVQTENILRKVPAAYNEFRSAKNKQFMSTGLSLIGGYLLGYQLGRLASTTKANVGFMAIGIGVISAAFVLDKKITQQITNSIDTYNSNRRTSFIPRNSELHFVVKANQIGFVVTF
jgi:hypothetical protein